MKRKIISILALLCLILQLTLPALADDAAAEDTAAAGETAAAEADSSEIPALALSVGSALLMDADSGTILYDDCMDASVYPASTTKIMTAYLAMKYGTMDDIMTLTDNVREGLDESSSTANLQPGEEISVYCLLQCLLISSANEAANALAIYVSGSIEDFVTLMNEEAAALGCTGTHFANPNGLHDDSHYTTAHDLAIIARAAIQYPVFLEICGMEEASIPATNLSEERTLTTTNYMLPGSEYQKYDYAGTLGIKTGYTTPAGYCLVSLVERDGRRLLSVVCGASRYGEGNAEQIGSFTETISLMDWGFANYDAIAAHAAESGPVIAATAEAQEAAAEETEEPASEETESDENEAPDAEEAAEASEAPSEEPAPEVSEDAEPSEEPQDAAEDIESALDVESSLEAESALEAEEMPEAASEAPEAVSPSPEATETPAPAAAQSGTESGLQGILLNAADTLGISVSMLLFSIIGIAAALLLLVILMMIKNLRRKH